MNRETFLAQTVLGLGVLSDEVQKPGQGSGRGFIASEHLSVSGYYDHGQIPSWSTHKGGDLRQHLVVCELLVGAEIRSHVCAD